jgi:hypothetical protein
MEVERTMEFILELHAKTEAEIAKLAIRLSHPGVKSRTNIDRRHYVDRLPRNCSQS